MKINKIIKRVILSLFTLILVFTLFSSLNNKVNAAIDPVEDAYIIVKGASVRTTGDKQGLRFECKFTEYEKYSYYLNKCGVLIAYGTATRYDIINSSTVNEKEVINAYTTECDDNGIYYVTIYNIPNTEYITNITVLPYVCVSSEIEPIYGENISTRNIASVTLSALNDGCAGDLLDTVKNYINNNYKDVYTDDLGNYNIQNSIYETKPLNLYVEFAKDFNESCNNYVLSITNLSNKLVGERITNQMTADEGNWDQTDIFNFFSTYQSKWGWLLNYFEYCNTTCMNSYLSAQINICSGEMSSIETSTWNNAKDLYQVLICFFTSQTSFAVGSKTYDFSKEYYGKVSNFNNKVYRDLRVIELEKIGDSVTISGSSTTTLYTDATYHKSFWSSSKIKLDNSDYYLCENTNSSVTNDYTEAGTYSIGTMYVDTPTFTLNGKEDGSVTLTGNTKICNCGKNIIFNYLIIDSSFSLTDMYPDDDNTNTTGIYFYHCTFTSAATIIKLYNTSDITFTWCTFTSTAGSIIELYDNCGITFNNCTFNLTNSTLLSVKKTTNGTGEDGRVSFNGCTFNMNNSKIVDVEYMTYGDYNLIYFQGCSFNTSNALPQVWINVTSFDDEFGNMVYVDYGYFNGADMDQETAQKMVSTNITNKIGFSSN